MRSHEAIERRTEIERRLVDMAVDVLLKGGFRLSVDDGGEETEPTRNAAAIKAALTHTDHEYLYVHTPDSRTIWFVEFIYGNDGHDVIADNTGALDAYLKPVADLADLIADGAE